MTARAPRGPYAKTARRKQEILEAALDAYAGAGASGVTLREIAGRVGLTEAALLHHFGSKDALLVGVLAERDRSSDERHTGSGVERLTAIVRENTETPGLVKLFTDLAAASSDPAHPAHAYFAERYARLAETLIADEPRLTESDAPWVARIVAATLDGLQVQWLLDPTIDMEADVRRLVDVLVTVLAPGDAS
ncbi:TetR/AcrR family transcriptional regulator [Leifsonia poae]|uniref:TetR/AcrR family transcriptional regulator n=1 Tax=Leifsonia poae TaxID=110933 RepID=UPI001CC113D3|nr:TetR/AcrR family transcriptional regulator [Leifsonia poae]